ncbi:hypothetical protein SAMN04487976_102192 [Xaviernesmea oryzae]|nr:hypothetical protein SAMN04487976_102192 [Xaviernesmea oryzae]
MLWDGQAFRGTTSHFRENEYGQRANVTNLYRRELMLEVPKLTQ